MGRRLIDYSQVLGKPINQADIRGAGVAYSVWEKEELLTTLLQEKLGLQTDSTSLVVHWA